MQYCRIISLDNKNAVKFTCSRVDNSTTNESVVMKIAHAQLHMFTNIMYKFQSSTCRTVGGKLWKKLCPWMTDSHGDSNIPISTLLWGGINTYMQSDAWSADGGRRVCMFIYSLINLAHLLQSWSIERGLMQVGKLLTHVSLRSLHQLTCAIIFRFLEIFCMWKEHSILCVSNPFHDLIDWTDP